eukprot:scaffold11375_cov36-Phaeocystis_antarctica.AAC.1
MQEGVAPFYLYHGAVQKAMQEGPREEAAVPEDLLQARLPHLNGPWEALVVATRPVSEPGCTWSHVPLGLKHKRDEGQEEERTAPPDPRKLGCAHKGPGSRVGMAW